MFDWSGKNAEKSGNFDILCEWQPCFMFNQHRDRANVINVSSE